MSNDKVDLFVPNLNHWDPRKQATIWTAEKHRLKGDDHKGFRKHEDFGFKHCSLTNYSGKQSAQKYRYEVLSRVGTAWQGSQHFVEFFGTNGSKQRVNCKQDEETKRLIRLAEKQEQVTKRLPL